MNGWTDGWMQRRWKRGMKMPARGRMNNPSPSLSGEVLSCLWASHSPSRTAVSLPVKWTACPSPASSKDAPLLTDKIFQGLSEQARTGCVWLHSGAKSCLPLCDPMDYSLLSPSVHGIFQVRTLEWVAISSSRESSPSRDRTHVSCIGRQILYHWATWEDLGLASRDFTT